MVLNELTQAENWNLKFLQRNEFEPPEVEIRFEKTCCKGTEILSAYVELVGDNP